MVYICDLCEDILSISSAGPVGSVKARRCKRCVEWSARKITKKKDKKKEEIKK